MICKSRALLLLALTALWLQACSSLGRGPEPLPRATIPAGTVKLPRRIDDIPDAVPRKEPRSRYGNPETYEVFGRTYRVKRSARGHIERGTASWYGPGFHAERTSSGETYDMYAMTAAHKTLPIPVYVRVTNLENGRAVVVRVNDRGPFVGDRIIDLSYTAAHKLDMVRKGTAQVEIRVIEAGDEPPPGPVVVTAAAAAPAAASSSSAADIGVSSRYLQTGSFVARENAEAMVDVLARSGIRNASVREVRLGERAVFRVRVGPLDNAIEADDMIERLRIAGIPDARPAHE
ncbi:MAG: septal ring lytic transglycosylase RlpA family protein [Gammaproteobacteria bacterium]|nr:septal ring lytic transglycosylase RlpA family protein [Gammaproteobacteria bacterium]